VVLLAASGGGTGERLYLAVVKRNASQVASVATALLGDRVPLRAARIESRRRPGRCRGSAVIGQRCPPAVSRWVNAAPVSRSEPQRSDRLGSACRGDATP